MPSIYDFRDDTTGTKQSDTSTIPRGLTSAQYGILGNQLTAKLEFMRNNRIAMPLEAQRIQSQLREVRVLCDEALRREGRQPYAMNTDEQLTDALVYDWKA